MKCTEVRSLISEFSVGMLEGRRKSDVEAHLASCPDCSIELERTRRVMLLVDNLDEIEPPVGLWNGVYNRITAPVERESIWQRLHRTMKIWSVGVATAVVILALLVGRAHYPVPDRSYAPGDYVQGHAVYASQDLLADQAALNSLAAVAYRDSAEGGQQ